MHAVRDLYHHEKSPACKRTRLLKGAPVDVTVMPPGLTPGSVLCRALTKAACLPLSKGQTLGPCTRNAADSAVSLGSCTTCTPHSSSLLWPPGLQNGSPQHCKSQQLCTLSAMMTATLLIPASDFQLRGLLEVHV